MTGAYLRVKRNGKFQNIEIEHLTDEERKNMFENRPKESIKWINFLCHEYLLIASGGSK